MRKHRSALLFMTVCLAALGYFAWHGVYGSRGMERVKAREFEVGRLERKLDALVAERERLERKVALLRPDGIDPDMLDQQARALLEFAHPNDRVILLDSGDLDRKSTN